MSEIWLPVLGAETRYQVSDHGNVKSLVRTTPKILQPIVVGSGYRTVKIGLNGTRYISHLVLESFVSVRPRNLEACHNNGNKLDDRLTNLRWDTHAANIRDQTLHGTNFNSSKLVCIRGHELSGVNLCVSSSGIRVCRACRNARSYASYHRLDIDIQAVADRNYERILSDE